MWRLPVPESNPVIGAIESVGRGMENALNFFGIDFKTEETKAREAAQTPSKALEFFGQDFSTPIKKKPPVELPRGVPEHSFDTIFQNLIQQESKGVHTMDNGRLITSKAGAQGITQLMPKTASKPGFGIEPVKDKSESEYKRVGKEYLQALYNKFGDWEKALAAYNFGLGNVQKAIGKEERFGGSWKDQLPEETQNYIKNILGKK